MAKRNTIVSTCIHLDPSGGESIEPTSSFPGECTVELDQGCVVRLDPENSKSAGYGRILADLARLEHPVYLETDPSTSMVTRLRIPHVARPVSIDPVDEGYFVPLEGSQARFLLRRGQADSEIAAVRLVEALRQRSTVTLTAGDTHEILDVRPSAPWRHAAPPPPAPWEWLADRALDWARQLEALLQPISWGICGYPLMSSALRAFDAMKALSCDPNSVAAPCIPFLYPDEGCEERAHEMCRLMRRMGFRPGKVWLVGSMDFRTPYFRECELVWSFHVAPTLWVHSNLLGPIQMVIDPSVASEPLDVDSWRRAQRPTIVESITFSGAERYTRYRLGDPREIRDPSFSQHVMALALLRLRLQERALEAGGNLPYPQCV